uniref:Transposase n=1 Tax=Caenorhabditis tropicalis TaxID=1561998 RepID=A0A1I7V3G2_9PELO
MKKSQNPVTAVIRKTLPSLSIRFLRHLEAFLEKVVNRKNVQNEKLHLIVNYWMLAQSSLQTRTSQNK